MFGSLVTLVLSVALAYFLVLAHLRIRRMRDRILEMQWRASNHSAVLDRLSLENNKLRGTISNLVKDAEANRARKINESSD